MKIKRILCKWLKCKTSHEVSNEREEHPCISSRIYGEKGAKRNIGLESDIPEPLKFVVDGREVTPAEVGFSMHISNLEMLEVLQKKIDEIRKHAHSLESKQHDGVDHSENIQRTIGDKIGIRTLCVEDKIKFKHFDFEGLPVCVSEEEPCFMCLDAIVKPQEYLDYTNGKIYLCEDHFINRRKNNGMESKNK